MCTTKARIWKPVALIVPAVGLIVLGSVGMVQSAVALADRWHVSKAIVGILVLAVLTSLPNAFTAIRLGLAGRGAALVTETIGSNSINLVGGILFPALVVGLAGRTGLVDFNFVWLLGMTCVALLLLSRTAGIGRRGGAALVALYAVFVAVQLVYAGRRCQSCTSGLPAEGLCGRASRRAAARAAARAAPSAPRPSAAWRVSLACTWTSMPTRSRSAQGPSGQPAPSVIALSRSSGLTPVSSSTRTQSFSSGISTRLTTKPGVSAQRIGSRPRRFASATQRLDHVVARALGAHHLDERHQRRRVEEMHAGDAFGMLELRRDRTHR